MCKKTDLPSDDEFDKKTISSLENDNFIVSIGGKEVKNPVKNNIIKSCIIYFEKRIAFRNGGDHE